MTDYTIAVVKDAICVLDAFNHSHKGLTLTEIIDITELGKNKVFRLLNTLEQGRMIYRDEHGRFHLGLKIFELAQNVHMHDLLLDVCQPVMDDLSDETQESIFLGVVSDRHALCIASRESSRSIRLFARVGIKSPLYKGGVPKVLLAYLDKAEQERHLAYFEATVDTKDEVIDWQALRHKLAQIREQGYWVTIDELDLGAHSITAPIFDARGQAIAGMSIAGPSIRFSDDAIEHYINLILEKTHTISRTLGYTGEKSVAQQEMLSKFI